ncbi:unnamed protein product [Candida verbasci]|uniref:Uncharacterized protein n=1 Tax=Candida verbasci TaxID=1227364 RepID=A0A9W4TV08_9ASCO|nr:unnamed protein product [Candida verbasci]
MSVTKTVSPSRSNSTKQKLSLFSFGSNDDQQLTNNCTTSSSLLSSSSESNTITSKKTNNNYKDSPKNSISLESNDTSFVNDPSFIFERNVQDCCVFDAGLRTNSRISLNSLNNREYSNSKDSFRRPRSSTHNSSISLTTGQYLKNEDYIPPTLDASVKICNDKQTNLEDIEVYSSYNNRRNSSVLALNAALGKPSLSSPISRKNSLSSQKDYERESLSYNYNFKDNIATSPLSPNPNAPPKLHHSKSSLSFYSYAEMINNEEYPQISRRPPNLRSSYSQGVIPTLRLPKFKSNNNNNNNNNSNDNIKSNLQQQGRRQADTKSTTPVTTTNQ